MHFLHFRSHTETVKLELPDGSHRKVKVTVNDAHDAQHVEDGDHLHATVRPAPVGLVVSLGPVQRRPLLLRNSGMPKLRQAFSRTFDRGLWAPVEGSEVLRG